MDLLRQSIVGRFLTWQHGRLAAQLVLLAVAAAVVAHGLFGPQVGPRNLATVLTSIHWRGLLVVALLAVGNLFCAACPMVLARDVGRRVVQPTWRWPRRLRGKWIALVLLVLVLFAYELFDLWELPRATAWLVLGYFGLALSVDLTFKGASFCKYVCPIGQFNFVASTISPTELQVRDGATCHACRTSDCVKGRVVAGPSWRLERRGCELGLFLPAKEGNLDCTFCFDCVRACPHDNIALATRLPAAEWLGLRRRSGVGRIAQRSDLAALSVVFTFAALLNAFAMTAPASAAERWIGAALGVEREAPALAALFLIGLVAVPAALLGAAAMATRPLTGDRRALRAVVIPYVYALVPLGCGVWLAHYGFHLLTGALTFVPVTQSAAIDVLGWPALGEPAWGWVGMRSGAVFPIQLGLTLLGTAGSIGLVHATSLRDYPARPGRASTAWIALVAVVAAAAVWVFTQPMDMRGIAATG